MQPYESPGSFYLGKHLDPERGEPSDDLLLYDAKDLTTHAVCVGMTGSGKTGLCISLLEEAALDGIPALIIDPKGDIGNMLLTFPELRPDDFRPWIDEQAAGRKGMTPDEFAASRAELWERGLADWGQTGERIQKLRDTVDLSIYTPGSSAGLPLRVLRSFEAPPKSVVDDADTMRERVASTVAGILGLLGIDADPVRSQEHVLLSTILDKAWREGRDLDFASLIGEIQSPPFETIGVLDLDSVMPAKKRFELAMAVNTLLASPTFSAWTHGEPMDINSLLYTTEGKPRVSILSISHLAESERMFFVTLLLNEVVSWVRSQSGTTSLRAIIYMDEVFGFFPPVAEPPSKRPMLTLLKQARAYGVGCVLATQNPVDLDYKGLSNAGTWFLGRLQTERDLKRVLDGLEGATANAGQAFDRDTVERTLAGLKSRVFLMNNVHNDGPSLFHTRWAMSYLRGPMTRDHIKTLMADRVAKADDPVEDDPETPDIDESETASVEQDETNAPPGTSASRPPVPPDIELRYLHANRHLSPSESLVYKPGVLGVAPLHFVRVAAKIDEWHDATFVARVPEREITIWPDATATTLGVSELDEEPDTDAFYESFPAWAVSPKQEAEWQRDLKAHAYRELARPVWHCKEAKMYSELGEDRDHFLGRATRVLSEELAQDIEKLEDRQRSKLDAIDERIRKAEQRVEVERDQWRAAGADSAVSFGAAILNKLFGGRKKISTSVRKAGRAMQQRSDIARAEENVEALVNQRREMQEEFSQELDELRSTKIAPEITEITVRPRKSDLVPQPLTIVWLPYAWTREREEALYTFREASNS